MGGRGSSSGTSSSSSHVQSATQNLKSISSASFVQRSNDEWVINAREGGGQIVYEGKGYDGKSIYTTKAWDANNNLIGSVGTSRTLNAAKQTIKSRIKSRA